MPDRYSATDHSGIASNSRKALNSSSEMDNVAATFAISVNNPLAGNGAAIASQRCVRTPYAQT
jgi:hypothetical protein